MYNTSTVIQDDGAAVLAWLAIWMYNGNPLYPGKVGEDAGKAGQAPTS